MFSDFGTYDIESNKWIHFVVLGFFDGREYKIFSGKEGIKKFLQHLNKRSYDGYTIYAHNGGRFDVLFLMQEVFNSYFVENIIEVGSSVIALKVNLGKAVITFADSYRLLPSSLKTILEAWNIGHEKVAFDFEKEEVTIKNKVLMKRLKEDTIGLYRVLEDFRNSDFVVDGKLRLTIGSQALDTFSKKFQPSTIEQLPFHLEDSFRGKFYSGGRVEVYKGMGDVFEYDVNSLYPFSMLGKMPVGKFTKVDRFIPDKIGFYHVKITSTPDFYITPYLVKTKEGNFFTNGIGEYFLSSLVIQHLKTRYGIRFKVLQGYMWKEAAPLFESYVETFYKIKKENAGNAKGLIAKYFLNVLYGKTGQQRMRESIRQLDSKTENYAEFDNDFGLVLVLEESKSKYILPFLAAWITEKARFYHWQLMQSINPHSIFYCDTDSIFTTARMKTGKGLGQLKNLGKSSAIFLAPKSYSFGEETKLKGFTAAGVSRKNFELAIKQHTGIEKTETRILSFKECVNRRTAGVIDSAGDFLKLISYKKKAGLNYDKRKMLASRKFIFETEAFRRDEIQSIYD